MSIPPTTTSTPSIGEQASSVFSSPAAAAGSRGFWLSPDFGNSISVDQGASLLFQANPERLDRHIACSGQRPGSAWVSSECRVFRECSTADLERLIVDEKEQIRRDNVPLVEFDGLPAPKPVINCQVPKPSDDRRWLEDL